MGGTDDRWLAGDAYEGYMGRWSRPLAEKFVEWLGPSRAGHWLDVGCGTGALTATLCRGGAPASVVACDPAEAFVEHGRRRLADARVSFVVAGSEALPRRDGGFDVTSPPEPRTRTPIKLVFEVTDVEAARRHLAAHGATMYEPRHWGGCDGLDPEGNVFQIVPVRTA